MDSQDIAGKLDEILRRVESSKHEIELAVDDKIKCLSADFAQTAKDVKIFKKGREFAWKREGNKRQHNFNCEVLDGLGQVKWALQYGKVDYAVEVVDEEVTRLQQRNKLIKIADTSEGGWETVKRYVANELASDSEDDKKIARADGKAVRQIKAKRERGARYHPAIRPRDIPAATVTASQGMSDGGDVGFSSYPQTSSQPLRGGLYPNNARTGACFYCGGFTHWKRECPFLNVNPQQPRSGVSTSATD